MPLAYSSNGGRILYRVAMIVQSYFEIWERLADAITGRTEKGLTFPGQASFREAGPQVEHRGPRGLIKA